MGAALDASSFPQQSAGIDKRVVLISLSCMALAVAAVFVAEALVRLIALISNISFYGKFSFALSSPAGNTLGLFVLLVPVIGGLIVGVMARFGSKAIRGHGIPEAMEQVLLNESKISPMLTFLKPVSAAIAIGTGGPFGAEGPIIATGGALGSFLGQIFSVTVAERKILLTAGAAAGMAAIFGTPVSAVLLSIELLLFEFRARSIIPVALAAATAAGLRMVFEGSDPVFAMTNLVQPSGTALSIYIAIGAIVGICSVGVTKSVYAIEDAFEKLPIHWMWWPALGALAVGVCGFFVPRTLGVGYSNISDLLSNKLTLEVVMILCVVKFVSWSISLGSGTSGGTMAPLFTIGGGLGTIFGAMALWLFPAAGVDLRIAALVGMAALFAGATRALLTSVVMAFETTLQPLGLLPLLGGCTSAYLVSSLLMKNTIMTEKIERRGVRVPSDYGADFLEQVLVRDCMQSPVTSLRADRTVGELRTWVESRAEGSAHQGFPVVDEQGHLRGVVTRRDFLNPALPSETILSDLLRRPPTCVYDDSTVREAADHMVNHDVGRLPVLSRLENNRLVGFITRSDVLSAHKQRLAERRRSKPTLRIKDILTSPSEKEHS
ncbi:MAG: chloride channel protein [Bacteroidota bacterium]|nr:chloride channel protein [Bacteroidota bacterium]MDP4235082.1 chloride channel protein [Bacteroidota bacterium]